MSELEEAPRSPLPTNAHIRDNYPLLSKALVTCTPASGGVLKVSVRAVFALFCMIADTSQTPMILAISTHKTDLKSQDISWL